MIGVSPPYTSDFVKVSHDAYFILVRIQKCDITHLFNISPPITKVNQSKPMINIPL